MIARFVPEEEIRHAVHRYLSIYRVRLAYQLPNADVRHVGGTSVPDCMTRPEIDIQVAVARSDYADAEAILRENYVFVGPADWSNRVTVFRLDPDQPAIRIHLVALDTIQDRMWRDRNCLVEDPDLRDRYGALKRAHEGLPLSEYRHAQARFFSGIEHPS